jgi:hypothetical protein
MTSDYTTPILDLVRKTPNTREGIATVVEAANNAIEQLDQDLESLLAQHDELSTIVRQMSQLYQILVGEELRKGWEVAEITKLPPGAENLKYPREAVLEVARMQSAIQDEISPESIANILQGRNIRLPWRNPKAVIATILTRSGQWKKIERGGFARIKAE